MTRHFTISNSESIFNSIVGALRNGRCATIFTICHFTISPFSAASSHWSEEGLETGGGLQLKNEKLAALALAYALTMSIKWFWRQMSQNLTRTFAAIQTVLHASKTILWNDAKWIRIQFLSLARTAPHSMWRTAMSTAVATAVAVEAKTMD